MDTGTVSERSRAYGGMTKVLFMERDNIMPGIDDNPVTNEQAIEMAQKLAEKVHAREALKRVLSENAVERTAV